MKLTYFIYLQLTIRWQMKHFTVIYGAANNNLWHQNWIFFAAKKSPDLRPNLPICKPKSPYLSPRKYHMYAKGSFQNYLLGAKLFEPAHDKNQQNDLCTQRRLRSAWASAQPDQSLLFPWRSTGSLATHWAHSEDWTDWAETQADLSLCWAQRSYCWFS